MLNRVKRLIFVVFGLIFLAFGIIGIPIPFWPTTPFLILAVACFTRGSERMDNWMRKNRYVGPIIVDWQSYKVISLKAKIIATPSIIVSFAFSIYIAPLNTVKVALFLLCIFLLYFIWSKPSKRPN